MNKIKKALMLAMSLVMSTCLFIACGDKKKDESTKDSTPPSTSSVEAPESSVEEESEVSEAPEASEEPEIAAHTLSLLFEPFEDFGGRDGLYDYYDTTTFINETDTKIFFDIMQYARYDYTFWNQTDIGRDMAARFGESAKQGLSAAEAYDKYKHYIDEMVYDFILPNFDYMYENYYYQFDN